MKEWLKFVNNFLKFHTLVKTIPEIHIVILNPAKNLLFFSFKIKKSKNETLRTKVFRMTRKDKFTKILEHSHGDIYSLKWRRGIAVKQIKSHIRLEVIIAVDNKGKALILGCETGKAYANYS
jgi:hypothetical protein